ncbi:MAG: flavin-containing monooxygenase, partial [Thermomicrobiales bacterium]
RSDSDMFTLGFNFKPWDGKNAIADGPDILRYLRETAAEYGVDQHIRYHRRATRYEWSSEDQRWTVTVDRIDTGETETLTCDFLFSTSGYYRYEAGYTPEWPGLKSFKGQVVHPQHWPDDLDYTGKRVVVIGSGATAVTLIPSMARDAGHLTMLQRTPTNIVSQPKVDPIAQTLRRTLPEKVAAKIIRARFESITIGFYEFCRRNPTAAKVLLKRWAKVHLPKDFDYDKHLTPPYAPWDQRLCVVPGADLFKAIHSHKVDIVTDHIDHFTKTGIVLKSGQELEADVIVTATGLALKLFGGTQLVVDGVPVDPAKTMSYKGMMFSDVPNLAMAFGYTNASWTLKCELIARYVCRVLNYMDRHGYRQCTPRLRDSSVTPEPLLNFTSGYVQRALARLPRQGSKRPWKLYQTYLLDLLTLRFGPVNDGTMEFRRRGRRTARTARAARGGAAW